ncbi:probable methyltransferase At1g29790 [Lolium perenne]|uniref:probable methyltransferase At1g29790 n=1 Tax=Lolium perenne TaxID=4522 RepID=UPI0021E9FE80|nr:probable methyltransferase At1g29790 [Lolium perenne]XP_051197764.1 probable methyltransferase At1g29790 [Lolium perenne]XP_051197765.1 probable methyltransferase At1g29790 [Lolium perenne]
MFDTKPTRQLNQCTEQPSFARSLTHSLSLHGAAKQAKAEPAGSPSPRSFLAEPRRAGFRPAERVNPEAVLSSRARGSTGAEAAGAMGSVSLKLPASRRRHGRVLTCLCSPALLNLLMLISLLSTNLLAFFAFFAASPRHDPAATATASHSSNLSAHVAAIAREIGGGATSTAASLPDGLPPELLLFLTPHALPLGRDARSGLTHMQSSVAAACLRSPSALALLSTLMAYAPHSSCPRNATLPRRLVSKGCEPLPRRRCLSRGPRAALPASSAMGQENRRWVAPARHGHEFLVDDVLRLSAPSKIRIGFDVAGGAANFAARMRERGVTVVTSVLDGAGKPMNEFVAARGLFPLLLSPAQRFPFYDGVFDLVHVGATALDEAGAPAMGQAGTPEALEFFMFDVDRVLRVGGLLWIDSYLCQSEERRRVVVKLIERFGYKKLKWVAGEKPGSSTTSIYISAVLRKPARG